MNQLILDKKMKPHKILNIAAFLKNTRMVGPSLRDAIWVQGCSIRCTGCANQDYLPHEPRIQMPIGKLVQHFTMRLGKIDGCSILGGEPTEQTESVGELLSEIKNLGLSTVVFTGHTLRYLQSQEKYQKILQNTDLLIDGPFIQSLYHAKLQWRGSTNQELHLLTNYWSPSDLTPLNPSGEIILSTKKVLLHGVGTRALLTQL